MKNSTKTVQVLAAVLVAGAIGTAQAQTTIWSDNFESYTAGTDELVGYSDTSPLANYSVTVAAGTGVGGSQGLTWQADFLGSYSGWMQAQIGYSGGNPSGNTDPNLNDYTLSFDMAVSGPTSLNHLQLNLQGWSGIWYSGNMTQTGAQSIDTSSVTPGSGFQLITVNLGTLYGNSTGFDPTSQTYQLQWQVNGWELGNGGPDNGVVVTIDNTAITMVPEPATLALVGLGMTALLVRRRNR
ncbi:MAG: PEP-CTERM sorting domain-containing protein [Verrucomicrobiia bacterium]